MGNQPSFEQHLDVKDLQTNYTYEKKYTDNRFGEIKLLKEKATGNYIYQKDFSSNTPKEFEDYVHAVKEASQIAHPNILRVLGYNSKKEDLFCADFYKLSLFFEFFDNDLEQEIGRRKKNKEYFSETELWYILDSVASGSAYLQSRGIPHRDLRPYNIFITPQKDYKIAAPNIFRQNYNPLYFENFEGLESGSRYYSPELLQALNTPVAKRTAIDEYKSDVFSLGMTLMEAGLLEKVDAYDYDKKQINRAEIENGLRRLRQNYSENFVNTVESTLDFKPETRLDFIRLDNELRIYRKDIKEKARGVEIPGSPERRSIEGRTIEISRHAPVETSLRSASPSGYPKYQADDLDARVREAVRRSEAVIQRSSPNKHTNKHLDPYIQAYLRDDLKKDQSVLVAISPYLTSESKYTTTLTIEQPSYGRESQPINFSQVQREEFGDSLKRGGLSDLGATQPVAETFGQQQNTAYNPTVADTYQPTGAYSFGQTNAADTYTEALKKSGTNQYTAQFGGNQYGTTTTTTTYGTTPYGQGTTSYTTTAYPQASETLKQSGTGAYGTTSYAAEPLKQSGAGAYGTTSYAAEPLKQSGTGATYGTTSYTTSAYPQASEALKQSGTGATYGTTSYTTTAYPQTTDILKQSGTAAQGTGSLSQSGLGQYGSTTPAGGYTSSYVTNTYTTTTYGTGAGNYGTSTVNYSSTQQKDYAAEADELSKKISDRLNQSRVQQTY